MKFILIFLIFSISLFSQAKDTIYFNFQDGKKIELTTDSIAEIRFPKVSSIHNEVLIFDSKNYPNPAKLNINIDFELKNPEILDINIFDLNGNFIVDFENQKFNAGRNNFNWNLNDKLGKKVDIGVYQILITGKDFSHFVKVIVE